MNQPADTHVAVDGVHPHPLILVVEDDPDIGSILVEAIQSGTNYQVALVSDGYQLEKIVQDLKPHLFILDYQLPRRSGLEVYDSLQQNPDLAPIPVLFLSANPPTQELHQRGVPFLRKPFDVEELVLHIQHLLE
jgi:CheY-like chemotaxis protein